MKGIASFLLCSLLFSACNFSAQSSGETKKPSQGDFERINPLSYLDLKSDYYFKGNELIIDGRITDYATLAKFKDVTIQVFYQNAKGEIISKEKLVALDLIKPNQTAAFKIATPAPDSTRKAVVKLFDATGVK